MSWNSTSQQSHLNAIFKIETLYSQTVSDIREERKQVKIHFKRTCTHHPTYPTLLLELWGLFCYRSYIHNDRSSSSNPTCSSFFFQSPIFWFFLQLICHKQDESVTTRQTQYKQNTIKITQICRVLNNYKNINHNYIYLFLKQFNKEINLLICLKNYKI